MARKARTPTRRTRLGFYGQRLARRHLVERGYRVLEENYRRRWGELDIVSVDGDCLVFVEVRTKSSQEYGTPEESITKAKAERLKLLANSYLADHEGEQLPVQCRIDVVVIELDERGRPIRLAHIENAIQS